MIYKAKDNKQPMVVKSVYIQLCEMYPVYSQELKIQKLKWSAKTGVYNSNVGGTPVPYGYISGGLWYYGALPEAKIWHLSGKEALRALQGPSVLPSLSQSWKNAKQALERTQENSRTLSEPHTSLPKPSVSLTRLWDCVLLVQLAGADGSRPSQHLGGLCVGYSYST